MNLDFRNLKAEEIDVRVATAKENGVSLLLYKDARVDMNILDEAVGRPNWQREHYDCKGNLFCRVGIITDAGWVWKADCGTESFTEAQKGEASDSFKRACFNWGIGRELYTAPFIWVGADKANIKENKGRYSCNDRFSVSYIEIENKVITALKIKNDRTGQVVFTLGTTPAAFPTLDEPKTKVPQGVFTEKCGRCGKEADIAVMKKAKNNKTGAMVDLCPDCAKAVGVE